MERSKFETIIDSVCLPIIIYVGMSLCVSVIYYLIKSLFPADFLDDVNALMQQGIANLLLIFILVPHYASFKKKYNVTVGRVGAKLSLYIIPLAFSLCIVCNIFLQYVPGAADNEVTREVYEIIERYNIVLSLIIVSILAPVVEELIFRGFMYDGIASIYGAAPAIIFTSLVFAIIHFNLVQFIYAFIVGIFLGYVKYTYKSLKYTIFMHLLMNFCSLIFVPPILTLNDVRGMIFIEFICAVILILTIYRIHILNREIDKVDY